MATKKTTKKSEGIKTLTQLKEDLQAKRHELLETRRGHAAGELANPHVLTMTRKEIARLLTAIRAAEFNPVEQGSQGPQVNEKEVK